MTTTKCEKKFLPKSIYNFFYVLLSLKRIYENKEKCRKKRNEILKRSTVFCSVLIRLWNKYSCVKFVIITGFVIHPSSLLFLHEAFVLFYLCRNGNCIQEYFRFSRRRLINSFRPNLCKLNHQGFWRFYKILFVQKFLLSTRIYSLLPFDLIFFIIANFFNSQLVSYKRMNKFKF